MTGHIWTPASGLPDGARAQAYLQQQRRRERDRWRHIRDPRFDSRVRPLRASFTFVDSDGSTAAGSANTIASPGLTVNVGDLVVAVVSWEGGTASMTMSDGSASLTEWSLGPTANASGDPILDVFYMLASTVSGTNSIVYTGTFGAAANRTIRCIAVMVFTPSSPASLDGTANVGTGNSTNLASGNITTTATDGIAFGAYAEFGATILSEQINSVAADRVQLAGAAHTEIFSKTYAAGYTGQATGQFSGANRWNLGVLAFKTGVANLNAFLGEPITGSSLLN